MKSNTSPIGSYPRANFNVISTNFVVRVWLVKYLPNQGMNTDQKQRWTIRNRIRADADFIFEIFADAVRMRILFWKFCGRDADYVDIMSWTNR